jgi:hypothetical protein
MAENSGECEQGTRAVYGRLAEAMSVAVIAPVTTLEFHVKVSLRVFTCYVDAGEQEAAGVLLTDKRFLVISQIRAAAPSIVGHRQDCTARGRDSGSLRAPAGISSIKKSAAKGTVPGVGGHEAVALCIMKRMPNSTAKKNLLAIHTRPGVLLKKSGKPGPGAVLTRRA